MPHLSTDFLDPHFWVALGAAIKNGLLVLVAVSGAAALLTFATGGTAPKNWPKKDDPEHAEAHHH